MTETLTIRNGIDVDQLLATIETIKDDPAVGTFTFRASPGGKKAPTTWARSGGHPRRSGGRDPGRGVPARG